MSEYRPGLPSIQQLDIDIVRGCAVDTRRGYAVIRGNSLLAWFRTEDDAKLFLKTKSVAAYENLLKFVEGA